MAFAFPAAGTVTHADNDVQLIAAAVVGIIAIIVLIVWRKMHPFLALTLGSAVLAAVAGVFAVPYALLILSTQTGLIG